MAAKVVSVVGARPQFIKAAVVSRARAALAARGEAAFDEVILHTGQHFDENMSEVFFRQMQIPEPARNLGIGGALHGDMTGRMLAALEQALLEARPDAVLVYGDTNSTLAGALAAAKLHIPVAHVEAGLRSFNKKMPEEINRVLTDHVSRWLFCPTTTARGNLLREGIAAESALQTGDVMLDAVLHYSKIAQPSDQTLATAARHPDGFYLATVHREENADDGARLGGVLAALEELAGRSSVVLPLHPRTAKRLLAFGLSLRRVGVVEPVGYFDMLYLLRKCRAVLTDSGGLQKEAFFFGKPCVTLRDETEWVELVEGGYNVLAGTDRNRILEALALVEHAKLDWGAQLYGRGDAGERIVQRLALDLGG